MPSENEDPNEEPQGRTINIRISRDTLLLLGALGFLAMALVLAFLIPTSPESSTPSHTPTIPALWLIVALGLLLILTVIVITFFFSTRNRRRIKSDNSKWISIESEWRPGPVNPDWTSERINKKSYRMFQVLPNELLQSQDEVAQKQEQLRRTPAIAARFLERKALSNTHFIFIFIAAMAVNAIVFFIELYRYSADASISSALISMPFSLLMIATSGFILPSIAIICLYINTRMTKYRIRKGYYGTRPSEVRELLQFILNNSDDPNLPGGKDGRIFPDVEELANELRTLKGTAGATQ